MSPLAASFYNRSVLEVARQLLGARLVRQEEGQRISGYIIETEAYSGESDLACHARAGRTPRTEVMYGPPGTAYVYFVYGVHWMLNIVAEPVGSPSAVLIRALLPAEGLDHIAQRRKKALPRDWTSGPARLCQALDIDGRFNGVRLVPSQENPLQDALWVEAGLPIPEEKVLTGPRVGIDYAPEPWRSIPWRFRVDPTSWNPSFSIPDQKEAS
jgi:DNA-3-methyladenine glycosylase